MSVEEPKGNIGQVETNQFVCSKCRNPIFTAEVTVDEGNGKPISDPDGYSILRLKCSYCLNTFPFTVKKKQSMEEIKTE